MKYLSKSTCAQGSSLTVRNYLLKSPHVSVHNQTYSKYKSHNTAKGLVAIAPNGSLTFVSDLHGGHCSDKINVEHCGILQLLEEGDSVMADPGLEIRDLLLGNALRLSWWHLNTEKRTANFQFCQFNNYF